MKKALLAIILLGTTISAFGQQGTIDLTQIKVNDIPFDTSSDNLTKKMGPHKLSVAHDDCGYFDNEDNLEFVRYIYPHFTFLGKTTTGFHLDKVDFSSNEIKMTYQGKTLSNQTSLEEFCKIFNLKNQDMSNGKSNEALLLLSETRDDGARFLFKDGKLSGFEYYFPC